MENSLTEEAKKLAPLITVAAQLKDLEEWKAVRELLQLKIRERETTGVQNTDWSSPYKVGLDQGLARGLQLAIDMVELIYPEAVERMKKSLDSKPK